MNVDAKDLRAAALQMLCEQPALQTLRFLESRSSCGKTLLLSTSKWLLSRKNSETLIVNMSRRA